MIKRDEIDDSTSCFNKARDSERLFVMLARDPAAPVAIRAWVAERIRLGKNVMDDAQIVEALDCAKRMEAERVEIDASRRQEKLWAEEGKGRPTFEGKCCPAHIRSDGYHSENCPSRKASPIRFSQFESTRDMIPQRCASPHWTDFVAWFTSPRQTSCTPDNCVGSACPHKPGVCWSPTEFADEGKRCHKDVEYVSLLVFDIDGVDNEQLDVIWERLRGYQYLAYATHSDRPTRRAVHVVVGLSRAVPEREWSRFWQAAAAQIAPAAADPACGDPARIYFMPSRPTGASYFITSSVNGQPLDVDAILTTVPARSSRGLEGTVSL